MLLKYQDDIARVRGAEAARLLETVQARAASVAGGRLTDAAAQMDPELLEQILALLLPAVQGQRSRPGPGRRLAQASFVRRARMSLLRRWPSRGNRVGRTRSGWRLPLSEATVLLVTAGLERAETELLSAEASRLGRSCGRLFWLNPLLRYEGFEPKGQGMRALLPHVDRLLAMHNVASLEPMACTLSATCRSHSRCCDQYPAGVQSMIGGCASITGVSSDGALSKSNRSWRGLAC